MRFRRDSKRGQSLVEFALVAPIFVLLLAGLFDLGRGVLYFNTISNASREAVRLAVVDQNTAAIQNEAIDSAVGVMTLTTGDVNVAFLAPDLTTNATCSNPPHEIGCIVQVEVTYSFQPVIPVIPAVEMKAETHQPIERRNASP